MEPAFLSPNVPASIQLNVSTYCIRSMNYPLNNCKHQMELPFLSPNAPASMQLNVSAYSVYLKNYPLNNCKHQMELTFNNIGD